MTPPTEPDFRVLLDALNQCVLLHDAETKAIVWANRAACVALGFTLDERAIADTLHVPVYDDSADRMVAHRMIAL